MAMGATDEKTRNQFLDQARQDVHRAEMIITAMRDLSRIDARTDPPATCDALQVVRDAVEARRSSDTRHTYLLEADAAEALAPGQLTVGLGCHRLRQAVENLMENAAGFSPEGSTVRVAISLLDQRPTGRESDGRGTGGGPRVQIVVDDEGPGLGDDASRVFERFYTTRPSEAGHLGLGLAIVRALCERAGGTVKAGNAGQPGGTERADGTVKAGNAGGPGGTERADGTVKAGDAGGPGDEARSGSEHRTGARMTIELPRSTPPDAADRPLVV
jgi:signal transduction histidine kinase